MYDQSLDQSTRAKIAIAALDGAYDSVLITTPELELPGPQIVYVNPAFCRLTGYDSQEVMGKTPRILQGPKTDRALLDHLRKQLSAGLPFAGETVNYRKDGSEYLVQWKIDGIRNAAGNVVYWVAIQRDVSEERRLVEELRSANASLHLLANRDGLTGLANRRELDDTLERECRRAARESRELSVVMLDVDYFKQFNDRQGHLAGDDCLRAVAAALRETVGRGGDCVGRYGGEEFMVILPNTSLAGAVTSGELLRQRVDHLNVLHPTSPFGRVTVSAGVASARGADARPEVLIAQADGALYEAKRRGRNQLMTPLAELITLGACAC